MAGSGGFGWDEDAIGEKERGKVGCIISTLASILGNTKNLDRLGNM